VMSGQFLGGLAAGAVLSVARTEERLLNRVRPHISAAAARRSTPLPASLRA
jgi:hypothetical protein